MTSTATEFGIGIGGGDATDEPVRWLRPSVHVSHTTGGIHLRGWSAACTIEGGTDLSVLWNRLEPLLLRGVRPRRLEANIASPGVRRAVRRLLDALGEHDLLTDGPPARLGGAVGDWLDAVALDPAETGQRIGAGTVTVAGAGQLAAIAARSLAAAGMRVTSTHPVTADPRAVLLTADGGVAVGAGASTHAGFVTPPVPGGELSALVTGVADRLGLSADDPASATLSALVADAAAHRLVCRVAGLPDSAAESRRLAAERADGDHLAAVDSGWPAVLVARADPMTTAYHPWTVGAAATESTADGHSLDSALRRLDALCDNELGVLPMPEQGTLPQLPAALATCRTGGGLVVGIGASTGAARLDAVLRAAAGLLTASEQQVLAVGADREHADGILLRREAFAGCRRHGHVRADIVLAQDPMARRWWTALTDRFGLKAEVAVDELADGVYAADVRSGAARLGWAVEATAGYALAFAALAAVATVQAERAGLPVDDRPSTVSGSAPGQSAPYGGAGTWMDSTWTWPDIRPTERGLQRALSRIVPPARRPREVRPAGELGSALAATGFAVSTVLSPASEPVLPDDPERRPAAREERS